VKGRATDSAAQPARQEGELDTRLRRTVGPALLFLFILGDMVGGGIYALVGEVGGEVGGAIWAAFATSAVLALLTALSYAELVTRYPLASGAALYTHQAFRSHFATFMVAFAVMMSGLTSAGALARAFAGDYFGEFVALPVVPVAVGLVALLTLINLWGISQSTRLNALFTVIEIAGLLLIVVIGVMAVGEAGTDVGRNFVFKEGTTPFFAIVAGVTLAFYALIGFEDSANLAEEVKRPSRTFPRALIGALLTASLIYVVVSFVSSMVVPTARLADSSAPLLEVVKAGPLAVPPTLFSAIGLFALTNGALINMIMASRLLYGMANQRVLPGVFGSVLRKRRTPWVAALFAAAVVIFLVIISDLEQLATTTVMLLLAVFVVVNVTVLILRRDRVDHEHFRTWAPLPVLAAATSLFLITQNDAVTFLQAGVLLGIGLVLWVITRLVVGPPPKEIDLRELAK
jgi:APA family basic amino acid/polyamine antiporter